MKRIEESAEFIKEATHTDIYFDTPDYQLMKKNRWLRKRNNDFEYKVAPDEKSRENNVYEEIVDPEAIIKKLDISKLSENFEENLKLNGFQVLVKFVTKRRKFKIKDFTIDMDEVDYGYNLCEIEKMVENESEVEKATQEIFDLATSLGLEIKKIRGKGMEYFFRFNPEIYKIFYSVRYE